MDLIIGLGQIGQPLHDLLALKRDVRGIDLPRVPLIDGPVDVMHVCFPYDEDFELTVVEYSAEFDPGLIIIHSTVLPGTTRNLHETLGWGVAYSPIRGRHQHMARDLVYYTKFVSAVDQKTHARALNYLHDTGLFKVGFLWPVEALELAKLWETSYSGLLIAWAQELKRYADGLLGVEPAEVLRFTAEVDYLPNYAFHPGHIGGHCIMQNLDLLAALRPSSFIHAIKESNMLCTQAQRADPTRYEPRRLGRE